MSQINVRVDDELKARVDSIFDELGINVSTAVNIFFKQVARENGIPFEMKLDPFYSESNMQALRKSIQQLDGRNVIVKTMEELEDMADNE